jgi:hypothetical protein
MKPLLGMAAGLLLTTGMVSAPQRPTQLAQMGQRPLPQRSTRVAQTGQQPIAKLISVSGRVRVKSYAQDPNWRTAILNMPLLYGDILKVPPGSSALIECTNNPAIRRIVPNDGVPWGVASACPPRR